ncbi:OLC1v1032079C1 [Oldenlandia corymbosa var. corymbosa]|uniref:OLC1v1032079C1 n=1 Tax=Oldenlandia corymbosa var. corymbosa TaxID=529605 RepID=A0AAV1CN95_OLDCO|nr:OLC1v1032079C1 [Oldenlandia corymbosa var. corymbosa]
MGLSGKLQFRQEIKSPGNAFPEIFYGSKKEILPKICPERLPVLEILDGNWGEVGCTIVVHYQMANGETVISTEKIVASDAKNMSITYDLVGDLMKHYKSFKVTLHMESQGQKTFLVITYEYEKQSPDVLGPDGIGMVDFASELISIVDAYVLNNITSFPSQTSNTIT